MKLNDSNGTTKTPTATLPNRDFLHRDENKNTTATSASIGVCTRRKIAAAQAAAADVDNNNDNFDKTNPTQGDTLNQIKAMRRRHSRMPTNITSVPTLLV